LFCFSGLMSVTSCGIVETSVSLYTLTHLHVPKERDNHMALYRDVKSRQIGFIAYFRNSYTFLYEAF
jgi:hypothetical protein